MNKKASRFSFDTDTLFLLLFAILAVLIFWIRYYENEVPISNTTNTLFSFFEVVFSLGIGWFLQRKESAKQYQDNLKKYALSAYRRINDIEKSVKRAKSQIEKYQSDAQESISQELSVVYAIIEGTDDTVQSSISDWSDILEEEIKKKDRIDSLIDEKNKLILKEFSVTNSKIDALSEIKGRDASVVIDNKIEDKIAQIEKEIDLLKSELPRKFLFDDLELIDTLPREGRHSREIYSYYQECLRSAPKILLAISPLDELTESLLKISNSKRLLFYEEMGAGNSWLSLLNEYEDHIGHVLNPLPESVYSKDFVFTLLEILTPITKTTERGFYLFEGIKLIDTFKSEIRTSITFEIPIPS